MQGSVKVILIKIKQKIKKSPMGNFIIKLYQIRYLYSDIISIFNIKKQQLRKTEDNKLKIVFLCQLEQLWSKIEPVVDCSISKEQIEVFIIIIPNGNFELKESDFLKKLKEKYSIFSNVKIIFTSFNNPYSLKNIKPFCVFYPRPFNNYLPHEYCTKNVSKYSKICLIPYGYNSLCYNEEKKISYNKQFIKYVSYLFVENKYFMINLSNDYKFRSKFKINNFLNFGYPAFEKYNLLNYKKSDKFTVLWTPRWTSDKNLGGTNNFCLWYKKIFNYFIKNKEMNLIFRPHPLAFDNYVKSKLLSIEELEQIKNVFLENENLTLDENYDYAESFDVADILISDISSLVPEFFLTGKPILFCSDMQDNYFSQEFNLMRKYFYKIECIDDLLENISNIYKNGDSKKEERMIVVKNLLLQHKNSSENIVKYLIDEYRRR